jgi:hypothetical protein
MNLSLPGVEKRLQTRYEKLVEEHTGHAHNVAAGPRFLPDENTVQAAAMAAWRFYQNPRITFTRLAQPLVEAGCAAAQQHCRDFALVPLDWSWLDYRHQHSRTDCMAYKCGVVGYKLLSALLVSDFDGQPLAPLCLQLQTSEGLFSSRFDRPRPAGTALDDLAPVMDFVTDLPLGKRPVFIIDEEADSVFHLRLWHKRRFLFLMRADIDRKVLLGDKDGEEMLLPAVAKRLKRERAFHYVRKVKYEGRKVRQYVAEAAVVLHRPAWLNRQIDAGTWWRFVVPGKPLPLRLVVTELRDKGGKVLEQWYLLSNVPAEVDAETIALWYFWRWTVESFYKLLKSAGQHLEHWQQDDGRSIFKRLLIASMACVLAWQLAHSQAPEAEAARKVVMRLSGRQLEYGKAYTLEGLFAGIWVLLAMMAILQQVPLSRLQEIATFVLNGSVERGPPRQHCPETLAGSGK